MNVYAVLGGGWIKSKLTYILVGMKMCENCCNMGCKYRGYVGFTLDNPPEQFEWQKCEGNLSELVCKKYQPDGAE
jgi:hypothetical protein